MLNVFFTLLRYSLVTGAIATGAVLFLMACPESVLAAPPPERPPAGLQWPMPAKNYASTHFSELDAITTVNAHSLDLAWSFDIGTRAEAAPIVVGTTMYLLTPSVLYALDLSRTSGGDPVRWTRDTKLSPPSPGAANVDLVTRGVCYADGKVFMNTLDGYAIAVDGATGVEIWKTQVAGSGERLTMAPFLVAEKLLIGKSGGGASGWLNALDAATGTLRWTDDTPNRTVTGWISYDPGLHAIYCAVLSPGPGGPESKDGKDTCSIVARDPDTGEARWSTQCPPQAGFDCDGLNANILADLAMSRHVRRVLLHVEKTGYVCILDRTTGDVISSTPFVPATRTDLHPAGRDIPQSAAYSPRTGLLYIPTLVMNTPMTEANPGAMLSNLGVNAQVSRDLDRPRGQGRLTAWDPLARRAAWTFLEPSPVGTGVLATAGDVVFYGTMDGQAKAVNAQTGKTLWTFKTKRAIIGQPMTYLGPGGKQYVAVLSGSEPGQSGGRLLVFSLP